MDEYTVYIMNIECGKWLYLARFWSCGVATAYTLSKMDKLNNPHLRMKIVHRKYSDDGFDVLEEKVIFEQKYPHGNGFKKF